LATAICRSAGTITARETPQASISEQRRGRDRIVEAPAEVECASRCASPGPPELGDDRMEAVGLGLRRLLGPEIGG
jgi:hypothetical protein